MCIYAYLPRPNMYAHLYKVHVCFMYDGYVKQGEGGERSKTNREIWLSKQPTFSFQVFYVHINSEKSLRKSFFKIDKLYIEIYINSFK